MAITIEVIEIGDFLGIILPHEVLERLRVDLDDTLYLTATPGGIGLARNVPDLAGKLENA
jgi:hypothetical protein